jgi:hypothetical protein
MERVNVPKLPGLASVPVVDHLNPAGRLGRSGAGRGREGGSGDHEEEGESKGPALQEERFGVGVLMVECTQSLCQPLSEPSLQSRPQPCAARNRDVRVLLATGREPQTSRTVALPCSFDACGRRPPSSFRRRGADHGLALLRREPERRAAVLDRDLRAGAGARRRGCRSRRARPARGAAPCRSRRGRAAECVRVLERGDDDLVDRARPVVGISQPRGGLRRVLPARSRGGGARHGWAACCSSTSP